MDVEDGKKFYGRLIAIAKGDLTPEEGASIEQITFEVWQTLRSKDEKLANDVLKAAILCLEAQVDARRLSCANMEKLLEYRGEEGGVE